MTSDLTALYDSQSRLDPRSPSAMFLAEILKTKWHVFDAAGGDGCDSVMLFRHGHLVMCNELRSDLLSEAKQLADLHGGAVEFSALRWETMNDMLAPDVTFDAVIVTRNAFAMAETHEQKKALENFMARLNRNGILVIDERGDAYSEVDGDTYHPHSFKQGELLSQLEKVGRVKIYADFDEVDQLPSDPVHMLTYVVHK